MVEVAASKGVTISAPSDGFVSFFNSPYHPHIKLAALDIYISSRRFGFEAPSPVKGKVRRLYPFEPPVPKWFNAPRTEYAILIECSANPEIWAKILHIQPSVREGDDVDVGTPLGWLIRDGFFHPWTDPHMHIELRNRSDPIRATGGYPLEPKISNTYYVDGELDRKEVYGGRVVALGERYALVELQAPFTYLEPFFGLCGLVGDEFGLIDGGIPHYQWAGLLHKKGGGLSSEAKLLNTPIGLVQSSNSWAALLTCEDFNIMLDGLICVGLSCYLNLRRERLVKIILPKGLDLQVGQKVNLKLTIGGAGFTAHLQQAFEGLVEDDIYSKSLLKDRRRSIASILTSFNT
jgi:hypothetical protein